MTELSVKRQKISSHIRRTQIQKYMASCRAAFDNANNQPEQYRVQIDLEPYKQQMDNANYSEQSLVKFLSKMNELDIRKIECCHLLVQMKRVLMHLSSGEYLQLAIKLANSILVKIINETKKNNSFLDYCFQQLFELISQQKFKMFQIWQSLAFIKNQVYFRKCYRNFIEFLFSYKKEIDQFILPILKTLLHFTFKPSQKNSQAKLDIIDHSQIMGIVKNFFDNYVLGDVEMKIAANLCYNIFQQHSICTYQMLMLPEIVPCFIKSLGDSQQTQQLYSQGTEEAILSFVGVALCCEKDITTEIIKNCPKAFEILSQKLPVKNTFNKVSQSRPIKWTHQNKNITTFTVIAFANLAMHRVFNYKLMGSQIIKQIVELSAYPSQRVKNEVAYFFWNLLVTSDQQTVQILCEKDILWALRNLLQINDSPESLFYCVKCFHFILKSAEHFPNNNMAWHYNSAGIYQEMQRNGSIKILERLVIHDSSKISEQAEKCLNYTKMESSC